MNNEAQIDLFERHMTKNMLAACDFNDFWSVDHSIVEKDVSSLVNAFFDITNGWIRFSSDGFEL
jgi:hypothetical protein